MGKLKRLSKLSNKKGEKRQRTEFEDTANDENIEPLSRVENDINSLNAQGKELLAKIMSLDDEGKNAVLAKIGEMMENPEKPAKISRKSRLDQLAKKVEGEAADQELEEKETKTRKMIDNYAMGIENDEDEAFEPKDFDKDSLYCEDEDSGNYSEDSDKKNKKNRKGRKSGGKGKRKVKTIKPKNKMFEYVEQDYDSNEEREVIGGDLKDIDISDDEETKKAKAEAMEKIKNRFLNKKRSNTFQTGGTIAYSKNALAEKGCPLKIDFNNNEEIKLNKNGEKFDFSKFEMPKNLNTEDCEIEFIDPERIAKEEKARKEAEREREEGPKKERTPFAQMPQTYKKRLDYMRKLKDSTKETTTFEEVIAKNKVTSILDFKKKNKLEEKPEEKIQQVDDYLNEKQEDGQEKDQLDITQIMQLEGDLDEQLEAEGEDGDYAPEAEGEGEDEEAKMEDEEPKNPEETKEIVSEILQNVISELPPFQDQEAIRKRKEKELQKLRKKIRMKQRAGAFLDNEAELGSDHEDNDGQKRDINNMDTEEILDRRLEFEQRDIDGLIDNNSKENADAEQFISKHVEERMATDTKETVDLITAIKRGHRGRNNKKYLPGIGDDEGTEGASLYQRIGMRQKKMDAQTQFLHNLGQNSDMMSTEEFKNKIIENCKNEGCDEEEQEEILKEQLFRKMKRERKRIKKFNEKFRIEEANKKAREYQKINRENDKKKKEMMEEQIKRRQAPGYVSSSLRCIHKVLGRK